ncbi:hypothetical protein EVAR_53888_1 [Eumeta japonica]|uniref:Ig-like domain-containing protein n=1 Tax=Eumeta variegata TaxID=151549 RepID=A0A4C1XG87_EUMVA|nr:hypothetical protein EVAR_53888_1 [Eumeta japonica]
MHQRCCVPLQSQRLELTKYYRVADNSKRLTLEAVKKQKLMRLDEKLQPRNDKIAPECGISKRDVDGSSFLVCTSHANPNVVSYSWKLKNDNDSLNGEEISQVGQEGLLKLSDSVDQHRTYLCYAKNSVGLSRPCEIDIIRNPDKAISSYPRTYVVIITTIHGRQLRGNRGDSRGIIMGVRKMWIDLI